MPLKQTVIPLLDHIEPLAQVVGAVNTVLLQGSGGSRVLVGANTDVHGLVEALGEGLGGAPVTTAAVIGAGATASSTLAALAQLGCASPVVYVRAMSRAGRPDARRAPHGRDARVPARSTPPPPRSAGRTSSSRPSRRTRRTRSPTPWPVRPRACCSTSRTTRGRPRCRPRGPAAGGVVVGGERMLLHQAAEQVRLMTGRRRSGRRRWPTALEAQPRLTARRSVGELARRYSSRRSTRLVPMFPRRSCCHPRRPADAEVRA